MISIKGFDYIRQESPSQVYSRLTWAVERVSNLSAEILSGYTLNTNRPWLGVLNDDKMEFRIIEPRGMFSLVFFQIVIKGKIKSCKEGSKINIKVGLGLYTWFSVLSIYVVTFILIAVGIAYGNIADLKNVSVFLLWLLIFPVFETYLLNRYLNKVVKKVEVLFEIAQS